MSAKRPGRERRNLSVLLTCAHCGALFHPWRYHKTAAYCSRSCRSKEAVKSAITKAQTGQTGQTGQTATASQVSATVLLSPTPSELQAHTPSPLLPPVEPPPLPELPPSITSQLWYQAGERRRQLAEELLTPDARATSRRDQVLVLAGDGAALKVRRGLLIAQEGWTHGSADKPPSHQLWPGVHRIGQIIILSGDGYVSFEALRLCQEQQIAVTLLGRRGELLASLTAEHQVNISLRRRQYAARTDGRDAALSREVIRRKLEGQRRTAARHPELPDQMRALDALDMALAWFRLDPPPPALSTLDGIRSYEGAAAGAYLMAMHGLPLQWIKADRHQDLPPHWRSVRERISPLSSQTDARHAVDPFNAMLNYCYACLESQTRAALVGHGFDVYCGLLHTDRPRLPEYPALVFDVMELARLEVDDLLLCFIARTTFTLGDFVRQRDGECRLHPQMARAVIAATRVPQWRIDSHAKWLRELLMSEALAPKEPDTRRPWRRRTRRGSTDEH